MSQRVPQAPAPATPAPGTVVDPSAHAIGMLAFGSAGMRVVRRWIQQVPPSTPVGWAAAQQADAVSLAELERMVGSAPAGWGLMLAGPEADVRAARDLAVRLGMSPAEIRFAVTGQSRQVRCPHCTATTDTEALPGESVHCGGCTVPLRIPAGGRTAAPAPAAAGGAPRHQVA